MGVKISAISYYLPDKQYTNTDFFTDFPEVASSSMTRIGVEKRHIVGVDQTASDMAILAAERLFAEHNINRSEIDFLIVCLQEQDFYLPASSSYIHGVLGLGTHCGAFDINLGCSAYVYGLGVAEGIAQSMGAKNILFLTSSAVTRTIHARDRSSRFIFGDAATATLLKDSGSPSLGPFVFGTDGTKYNKIIVEDGGTRNPISEDSYTERIDEFGLVTTRANLKMEGYDVFQFTIKTVPAMIEQLLAKADITPDAVDLYIFHQPNVYLNEKIRSKMNIPEGKFVHCMAEFGNTVTGTIPIALYEAQKQGRLRSGMTVVLAGFGVGLSWCATLART
jgi:3-oxoacyl-[acyl-carrier-protein] synthase-3